MARVLIIAGSDSGGGAGIQADIKTVTALGGYAATAVTAVTVQDTQRVYDIFSVPPAVIARQIEVVLGDIGADAIKTGMLASAEVIEAVTAAIGRHGGGIPLVVDPVMMASSGDALIDDEAVTTVIERLLPVASVATPNLSEARRLTGIDIAGAEDAARAGEKLLEMGAGAALITGGDGDGETIVDLLVTRDGIRRFEHPRIDTTSTHGTGCTLASALATALGDGSSLGDAVETARRYVWRAIKTAPGYGHGHGPLNHAHSFGAKMDER